MTERPRLYAAEGLVLRRRPVGEADALFSVLTAAHGRFVAVARGIRKPRSRMRGHLEPFTYSRFLLARGRTFDVFTQVETVRSFPRLQRDLVPQAAALYAAELLERMIPEREPASEPLELALAVLEALNEGELGALRWFEVRLLQQAGFGLQLDACARCGAELGGAPPFFAAEAGGLLCERCRRIGMAGLLLSDEAVRVARAAERRSLRQYLALRRPAEAEAQLGRALHAAYRHHLETEPSTLRHLEDVLALEHRRPRARAPGV